jgi:hypothetical protein
MVISHVVGRGAPELVRFWGEPPLIREPDVAVFGIDRVDEPEQRWMVRSPLRRYLAVDLKRRGAAVAAQEVLETVHGSRHEFVLLLDLDVIASEDFGATNFPGTGGLSLDDTRQALTVFARHPNLAALVVAGYNPARDSDGRAVKLVVDLLVDALTARLQEPTPEASESAAASATTVAEVPPSAGEKIEPTPEPVSTPLSVASEPSDLAAASSEAVPPEKSADAAREGEPPSE